MLEQVEHFLLDAPASLFDRFGIFDYDGRIIQLIRL